MKESNWYGLYSGGWKKEVNDASFSHPAKYARLLIRRIYAHALARGYIEPGDVILDPFGGVGLGALDSVRAGIHWVGVELEQPFVDMGAGCDCTGISPADWARFYGRWEVARYLDGRHWCPRCISEAGVILDEPPTCPVSNAQAKRQQRIAELSAKRGRRVLTFSPLPLPDAGYSPRLKQLSIFGAVDSPSYERNLGRIPSTSPHHYAGNLELFQRRYARDGATAILMQGDSRELGEVVAGVNGVVSSPPFGDQIPSQADQKWHQKRGSIGRNNSLGSGNYGDDPSNLGNLPATDAQFQAAIGSPPYAGQTVHGGGGIDTEKVKRAGGRNSQASAMDGYGDSPGQLGGMPEGSHTTVVSSPPYAESLSSDDPDKRGGLFRDPKRRNDKTLTAEYGQSEGQLGAMRIVSSPPFESSEPCEDRNFRLNDGRTAPPQGQQGYGSSDGQLGQENSAGFWGAARQIMEQVAQVLQPGAVAIWVLGGFVRDWEYVDFPDQWRRLGEACEFESLEWIRAWKVEEKGAQYTLEGELEERVVQRKSFFRINNEKKGALPVDFEVVLIQRRL